MALGPVVSLLFVSRVYVGMLLLITHIIFTHVRFFLRSFTSRKLHVSDRFCRERIGSYVSSIRLVKLIFLEFDE